MIRGLSGESFCTFGHILGPSDTAVRVNRHSISLTSGVTSFYRTSADTWLVNETGLTILSVSSDGVHYRDFCLDRQVLLNDGIWFSLTAFEENSSVQLAAVLMPREEKTLPVGNGFAAYPQLKLRCIYSLFYQEKEQGFLFPGEAHSMAELVYVDEGSMHSVAQGQDILLNQGDMVLYGPDQWHMQYADAGQAPRLVTMTFDGEGLDWERLVNRKFSCQRAVLLLQQMLREQEKMDAFSQDMIFSLFSVLLLQLQREEADSSQSIQMPQNFRNENEIIRRAQQYIGENVCCKLSVPVVAQGIGVSASYLTALFHKHLQIAPAEYIRRIKLQKSKQMIREGNMNFTEIAQSLQYSTIHHFSRQFKEKFGITPSEYAKAVRG